MKATERGMYSGEGDCYASYLIDCQHRSECHYEQITVHGSERLRDLVVTLLNNHFQDRPHTNEYRSVPIGRDE